MSTENLYTKLTATELSAIILKGSPTSNDRDTGFCSGSSEGDDDILMDHSRMEPRSPTDASEDSVEVKVTPITFTRNKRKSTEPSRVVCEQDAGPLKKRIRYVPGDGNQQQQQQQQQQQNESKIHFRPWNQNELPHENMPNPAEILIRHPGVTTLHRSPVDIDDVQEEPLALIAKKPSNESHTTPEKKNGKISVVNINHLKNDLKRLNSNNSDVEIPLTVHGSSNGTLTSSIPINKGVSSCSNSSTSSQRPQQRNYKNMTRERRIEANARERTRVHTISAAYDTLRKAIPSYSNTQKLSKLSVLRVACSYILTLSRMAGYDYSEDQSTPSISSCFEMVTKTIQTEGKIRKKKDE